MNVVIVHGVNDTKEEATSPKWESENIRHWKPWLKRELEKRGISVSNELYPQDWDPKYEEWKKVFERNEINENTILIGHSAGGGFLVRWLGETEKKVKKLILVAPAVVHGEWIHPEDLLKFKINPKVKNLAEEIVIFVSDDDSRSILESVEIISKVLQIKPIKFKGKGHFTFGDMGSYEFPELLEEILK